MTDFLILGGGLAGTTLAWRLWERGQPFLLVDRDAPVTASKIAAGLVTPITGMRLGLSWRYALFHGEAVAFYRSLEARLGRTFYHETPVVRLLRSEWQAGIWAKRCHRPEYAPYLQPPREPLVDPEVFAQSFGGFEQRPGGWLDTSAYLQASRAFFEAAGCWRTGEVEALEETADAVRWGEAEFAAAVWCTGWQAAQKPELSGVPFQSARGSILTVQADTRGESRVISGACWLVPRGDGSLRAGPTYEVPFTDPHTPSPEALAGLEQKLGDLLRVEHRITDRQTAVRPIVRGREALLGRLPGRPRQVCFNGLASKGVLRAPWLANHLLAHLLDDAFLDPDLDLAGI
jgi:glycine/D-amino acid oxidase-like deaminating enzyme